MKPFINSWNCITWVPLLWFLNFRSVIMLVIKWKNQRKEEKEKEKKIQKKERKESWSENGVEWEKA